VESRAVAVATFRLLASACCIAPSAARPAYQRVVKPDRGKAMNWESLNENSGSSSPGT